MENHSQQSLTLTPALRGICLAVVLYSTMPYSWTFGHRLAFTLLTLIFIISLSRENVEPLGLMFYPIQGWSYWLRIGIGCLLGIGIFTVGVALCSQLLGIPLILPKSPPTIENLLSMFITAPVFEEIIYRSLLIAAILPTLGPLLTILVGGIVFALIHIIGGNPGPDNQIAGFILVWAFLHSKSVFVPLAFHASGNFIAFSLHSLNWIYDLQQIP